MCARVSARVSTASAHGLEAGIRLWPLPLDLSSELWKVGCIQACNTQIMTLLSWLFLTFDLLSYWRFDC